MERDATYRFRAGDHVHHAPSGEDWVLACDQNRDDVQPAGWPETLARASDCALIRAASEAERMDMLTKVAAIRFPDYRGSVARDQLAREEKP